MIMNINQHNFYHTEHTRSKKKLLIAGSSPGPVLLVSGINHKELDHTPVMPQLASLNYASNKPHASLTEQSLVIHGIVLMVTHDSALAAGTEGVKPTLQAVC